ncbi:DDE superfamily endonuclease [Ceratobasidium sp. AG-Ba]|nr:DDE superfamily endonuclease [Ceratobasidium sp. AG-Ba]
MVADFVSANYGWLRLRPESPGAAEGEILTAQVVFCAGKQRNGWFGTVNVVQQLSRAMAIVKKRYPNEDHVFIFDNAIIHTKLPENLPNVSKMTLGPSQTVGGEEIGPSGEKIKINFAPATLPDGTTQQLYHPSDHPVEKLRGAFKGMATILEERNVPNAQKLKLICTATDDNKQGCLPGSTNCCARHTMMNQPDMLAQKLIIQTLAEAEGFLVLYLPKYHCELNPIEQCWGAAKRVYRDSPFSSSEADLKRNMLTALDSIRPRFAARSQRFVHAYLAGLSGSQAAWAMKKFCGHRIIPLALLQEIDELNGVLVGRPTQS